MKAWSTGNTVRPYMWGGLNADCTGVCRSIIGPESKARFVRRMARNCGTASWRNVANRRYHDMVASSEKTELATSFLIEIDNRPFSTH